MMGSKELVFRALTCKTTDRIPWVPFVGCHAAKLLGVNADEYFYSEKHIVDGAVKAYEMYQPDGLPVLFDLQLEAEALGCRLRYAKDNIPSVATHPLESGKVLRDLKLPTRKSGRLGVVMDAAKELVRLLGDKIALYGVVTGPFTLALHLMGTDIFYAMLDDPERVSALIHFCVSACKRVAAMYMEAGIKIIAIADPMTSQISSDDFVRFVSPGLVDIFAFLREHRRFSALFVCGDAKRNMEAMCACQPDNISIDENIPLDYAARICHPNGVSVGGNINLTRSMMFGTVEDNIRDAQKCIDLAGSTGFILSPGCDMPFDVPPENVRAITSLVRGNVVDFLEQVKLEEESVYKVPNYAEEERVIIDVMTLDSETSTMCQYIMEVVYEACRGLEHKVRCVEHKKAAKEAEIYQKALHTSVIPSICIDGELVYESVIPSAEDLRAEILRAIFKKQG